MSKRKVKRKPTKTVKTRSREKQGNTLEFSSKGDADFDVVGDVLDRYRIPESSPLPEEFEEYLVIPFEQLSELTSEDLHMHMACVTHQLGYVENLVANAKIELLQLEREFQETWHENYEGQNKKMNAERRQLDSGIWRDLDIARGIFARVETERNRLENLYKFFSRMLSSRQGGL